MKTFRYITVVLVAVLLSGCGLFASKEDKAFNACYSQAIEEQGSMTVEQVLSYLNHAERASWPSKCQRWAKLVDINLTENLLATQEADLELIDRQIEAEENAVEREAKNAAQTATAQAMPSPTATSTLIPTEGAP